MTSDRAIRAVRAAAFAVPTGARETDGTFEGYERALAWRDA